MNKGLEALELLTDSVYYALIECKENISTETKKKYLNAYDIIEKELKALEMIKHSIVATSDLPKTKTIMGEYYEITLALSQEEFDLLKEVLL